MASFVRISALLWADILVAYALFLMQIYLTDVWRLSFTHAAAILNIWGCISMILPFFFLFVVDAFLGNFMMLVLSSIAYTVGIGFIAMSTPPILASSTGTCKEYEPQCVGHTQKILFYMGMVLVAIGISGHQVSIIPFFEEQDEGPRETSTHQLPGFVFVVFLPLIGAVALPYVKPWSIRFGIPAICTAFATLLFCTCSMEYYREVPQGIPLTNVCRVFVAFASKKSKEFPLDADELYVRNDQEILSFSRTRALRWLEKAAIILPDLSIEAQVNNRWKLCSLEEVEEAKIWVRMVPIWITFIVCGIVSSIGNTYFITQANHLNHNVGYWRVPLPVFLLLFNQAKAMFGKSSRSLLSKSRKYGPPVGIGVAMIFSILCCITAARIEIRRLNVIRSHGLIDKPDEEIPMGVFWLLFQFFLLAGLDQFLEMSIAAFYRDQAPEAMSQYLVYFGKGVCGLGFMCNVLLVYVVGKISEKEAKQSWFQYTLNRSRLDRYYWVLAALSSINLLVFILVASSYSYRYHEAIDEDATDSERISDVSSDHNG